jgi:hypothetical protein
MSDAQALAGGLGDSAVGDSEVEVVTNRPAYAIRHSIDSFFATAGSDDLALLHICGVGITDRGDLFLAGSDTRAAYVRSSGLEAAFIRRSLARSRAQQAVLILDCRFGAAAARGTASTPETIDVGEHFGQHAHSSDRIRVLITASSAVEFVIEDGTVVGPPPAEQSPFTRALADALRTGRDDGGQVSLDALYDEEGSTSRPRDRSHDRRRPGRATRRRPVRFPVFAVRRPDSGPDLEPVRS